MITTHIGTLDCAREHARIMAGRFDLPAVTIWTREVRGDARYCVTPVLGRPHPKPFTWTPLESVLVA